MTEYKCERAKRWGYHSCRCRECAKRQDADSQSLFQRFGVQAQKCPHGVPYRYACHECDDPF